MSKDREKGPTNVVPLFERHHPEVSRDEAEDRQFRRDIEKQGFYETLADNKSQFIGDARLIHRLRYPIGETPPLFGLPMTFEPCLDDKTPANRVSLKNDHFHLTVDPGHFLNYMDSPGFEPESTEEQMLWARYYVATSVACNYLAEIAKEAPEYFNLPNQVKLKIAEGRSALIEGKNRIESFILWQVAASIALRVVAKRDAAARQLIEDSAKQYGEKLWSRDYIERLKNLPEPMHPHMHNINPWEYFVYQDAGLANPLPATKITKYAPFLIAIANR